MGPSDFESDIGPALAYSKRQYPYRPHSRKSRPDGAHGEVTPPYLVKTNMKSAKLVTVPVMVRVFPATEPVDTSRPESVNRIC